MGRLLIALGLLCAATYATLESPWRYATAVDGLLTGPAPASWPAEWARTASGVELTLADGRPVIQLAAAADGRAPGVRARLSLPQGLDGVRASVEAKADRMTPGQESWQTGRVQVSGYDARGRYLWYWPKTVAVLSGNTGWLRFETVIPTTADLESVDVLIHNGATSGVMAVRNLRVAGVKERTIFAAARIVLIVSWALVGLGMVRLLVRGRRQIAARTLLQALVAAALIGSLTPQPYLKQATGPVEDLVRSWLSPPLVEDPARSGRPDENADATAPRTEDGSARRHPLGRFRPNAFEPNLKQAGHFAVFFLLAFALRWAYPEVPGPARAAYLLMFALATESLQLFLITRGASLSDLAVDAAGIALASGIIELARRFTAAARRGPSGSASPGSGP